MPTPILHCISRTTGQKRLEFPVAARLRMALSAALVGLLPAIAVAQQPAPPSTPHTAPPTTSPTDPAVVEPAQVAANSADYRDPTSGVEIYTSTDDGMFPPTWLTPDIAATAKPLASADRERAIKLMKIALSKYPADLLRWNLERIYVVSDLRFDGIEAAGTNSKDRLYIKLGAGDPAYSDAFVEDTVHHEFGHMLQRNYADKWNADSWARCNPPDFHYGSGDAAVQAAREGHSSLRVTEGWNRRGFMSEYAATEPSEDFATIAGALFDSQPSFWLGLDKYPALSGKVEFVVAFYGQLDPIFTNDYFHALRPGIAYVAPLPPLPISAVTAQPTTTTPPVNPPAPPPTPPPAAPANNP